VFLFIKLIHFQVYFLKLEKAKNIFCKDLKQLICQKRLDSAFSNAKLLVKLFFLNF